MSFLDFDYIIISNNDFDENSLKNSISFLYSIGIRKFIFTVSYDPALHTDAWILDRIKNIRSLLHNLRPRGCRFYVFADIVYSQGIPYGITSLNRLSISNTSCVFMRFPVFCDGKDINADLNHLYFRRKCKPIFIAFETNIQTCSTDWITQIMCSQNFYCTMDLNYITSLSAEPLMRFAIRNTCRILPAINHSIDNYPGILSRIDGFKFGVEKSNYTKFSRSVHSLGVHLFPR